MAINPKLRHGLCSQPASAHDLPRGSVELSRRRQTVAGRRVQSHTDREAVGSSGPRSTWTPARSPGSADTAQPLIGGVLATAGGLVFTGEGNGNVNAYDAKSGKKLWSFQCGAGCELPAGLLHGRRQAVHRCGSGAATSSSTSSAATASSCSRCRNHRRSERSKSPRLALFTRCGLFVAYGFPSRTLDRSDRACVPLPCYALVAAALVPAPPRTPRPAKQKAQCVRGLPWRRRQLDQSALADTRRADSALHLPAAARLQGRPAQGPADVADRSHAVARGHAGSRRLFLFAEADAEHLQSRRRQGRRRQEDRRQRAVSDVPPGRLLRPERRSRWWPDSTTTTSSSSSKISARASAPTTPAA